MDGPVPKAIFYSLTFLSLAIMAAQIIRRARFWHQGKPINWNPDYLGGILKFALAQRKVMGSRPKSGAPMHLMLFYGFLALFLATTLLAIATYSPLIGLPNWHNGLYYVIYEVTFDLLGLSYVAGVTWAIIRRFKMAKEMGESQIDPETGRPTHSKNPLTNHWSDFAILGLLLILGISGYVLEAARISADPQPWDHYSFVGYSIAKLLSGTLDPTGYRIIWWQHVFWVLVFFATLPQLRLRHIIIGTLASAGTPDRPMGQLPDVEISDEEPAIGAAVASDLSRWHLMSLDACMTCGRCTEVCPAYGVGKILNPKMVVQDSIKSMTQGIGMAEAISEDALWACTTCNACVEACPVLIRHVDIIAESRRNLVSEGKLSGTASLVLRQIGSTGSAWGQDKKDRESWMKGLDIPLFRDGGNYEYLFFVGCAGATDPGAIKTSKALVHLLKKAGVSFACLGQEESCTGDPARRIGDESTFLHQRQENVSVFERYAIRKVITTCPHCFNTLKNEYDKAWQLEVFHHTQILAELVQAGKLQSASPEKGSVTFHDPCYLARVNGVSDPARILVGDQTDLDSETPYLFQNRDEQQSSDRTFAEPEHHGRKTLCCGAGGGRMWMEEEPNQRPANRRSEELLATGAKTVAVACPFCRIMLDAGIKQVSEEQINLVDLAEMMQEANQ